jgi:hypothetical protein
VALPVWVGTGLLVPMLLLAPVLGPAAMNRDQRAGSPDFWLYEQILVMLSLVGVGVGLPVALAGCTKARWPEVLGGPLVCPEPVGGTWQLQALLARMIAVGCVLPAGVKVCWAAGGTLALNADELDRRDLWWHMLSASTVLWALAGAWGILALTAQRGTRPVSPADGDGLGVVGDAVLVPIYNLLTLTDMQKPSPELPIAGGLARDASAVLGVMMGVTLLLVLHNRRRALRAQV